ncbi:ABC-F family ATP-binding cassette domain-containing protein [Acuticoccus sp. I52.16.1]|uniref:ABC-F family ATP-binding cassette domain-containing protein n=1 Tax=Acuticoccus sp. I52.16.1 TaxID=2928472 RepID=UPI001FD026DC|nr:ABC-F family ATP-binding cassette domain-containing protein [Acuticoccus sp. I52.16.1]UOM35493.1 ABC-F family ATP-binding cassette domain-containing protein [Acuticoccus sp. I52.16.1]
MLTIRNLTYRIDGRTLLEGADATVPAGAKVGLVGRNGCGKTTLFNLICGELSPESGDISLAEGQRIGRVEQEAPGNDATLIETVLAADTERAALLVEAETATDPHRIGEIHNRLADIDAYSAESRAASILAGLGFDDAAQKRPCSAFSGGWRMRVALAAILFLQPDLLLLDEPTNYLDLEGTVWLETYLQRYPHTVIVISHDRDMLDSVARQIIHVDNGKLVPYRGNYSEFERQRRERAEAKARQIERQAAEREHLQAFVDRFRAKASKAKQAQSRVKRLEKMKSLEPILDETMPPIRIPSPKRQLSPPIIAADRVVLGYDGKSVLRRVNIRVDDDDRIALLGANGNGKSTLAKMLAGRLDPMDGSVTRADRMKIAYFAQHQLDELRPKETPVEHVQARLKFEEDEKDVRARIAQMGLAGEKMDTPARDLSGGERAKLLLGLATMGGANLLILDEPTNHLDIDSRAALVDAINGYEGAVILISHDRYLVESCVDRLWLVADGTVDAFDDDMEAYRALILGNARKGKGDDKPGDKPSAADRRREAAEARAQLAPLRKKVQAAEKDIARAEGEIAKLDAKLEDPDLYTRDPAKATQLSKARADWVRARESAEEAWLEASEAYEAAEAGTALAG